MNYHRRRNDRPEKQRSLPVFIGAAVVLLIVLVLAIFSTVSKVSAPDQAVLVVGTNTPFFPFEDRKGDQVVGFDIDLAERIAKALKQKLMVKDFSEFDALLPALQSGTIDMVISAMTIRGDRDEIVDFSNSYFNASQAILTIRDKTFSYSGDPRGFKGLRVGYQEGTTSQFWVEENLLDKVAVAKVVPFGDLAFGLQLLQLGSVDAIIIDEPVATAFAKTNPDLAVRGIIETVEKYGIAVAEGDPQKLLPVVNEVLKQLKKTGEYDKLIADWFGDKK